MNELTLKDLGALFQEATRRSWTIGELQVGKSYRLALGKEVIQLGIVEFRILLFLASRPYHAFSPRSIAEEVSTEQDPVTMDTVDQLMASLIAQLGPFHDYVQAVPYIGYRFKA